MAKVVLFISMSLDRHLADDNGSIEWLSSVDMVTADNTYQEFYKDVSSVVMGRTTYDQITNVLAVDNYPYSNVDSYVITRAVREDLENVFFRNESVVELVKREKEKYDKILWIVGGSTLIKPLVEANLIDEYQIAIIPILLGSGIPLFRTFDNTLGLKLLETKTINDMVYLTYQPK